MALQSHSNFFAKGYPSNCQNQFSIIACIFPALFMTNIMDIDDCTSHSVNGSEHSRNPILTPDYRRSPHTLTPPRQSPVPNSLGCALTNSEWKLKKPLISTCSMSSTRPFAAILRTLRCARFVTPMYARSSSVKPISWNVWNQSSCGAEEAFQAFGEGHGTRESYILCLGSRKCIGAGA